MEFLGRIHFFKFLTLFFKFKILVIDLFEASYKQIQFPVSTNKISVIDQNTVETFRELLTLMHSISETFLEMCSLKKAITGSKAITNREISMLFGYSQQYGTGLEPELEKWKTQIKKMCQYENLDFSVKISEKKKYF